MKKHFPPYVVSIKDRHGNSKLYFKRRNLPKSIPFHNQDLCEAFYTEYATFLNGPSRPKVNSFLIKGLITDYTTSKKFTDLAPRTKSDYLKLLDLTENKLGDVPVASIERPHVIKWHEQLIKDKSAHKANYWLRVFRVLLERGLDLGLFPSKVNPAVGVSETTYTKRKGKPWPKHLIEAARDALPHDDRTRLVFELLYCTGQRVSDVLKMTWGDIRGDLEAIAVKQGKTGADLELPLEEDLIKCLRLLEISDNSKTIVSKIKGGPLSYRMVQANIMKLRKQIGAEEHSIHDIRHTVASEMAAAGAEDKDGMAITGHKSAKMYEYYSASTRQRIGAKRAFDAREQNKNKA